MAGRPAQTVSPARVGVAMSGGVDSSTTALLLRRAGWDVFGVTALFRPASAGRGGEDEAAGAARVCRELGIEHLVLDARTFFERRVIGPFAADYAAGLTPNPCVVCNARAKFGWLLGRVLARGGTFLATGHYARKIGRQGAGLAEGVDEAKSQAYFLARVTPAAWRRVVLPLGEMTKEQTRDLARAAGLPCAEREESQEICFVPPDGPADLVAARYPGLTGGPMIDPDGRELGRHQGLHHFTVGQRRGLGLALGRPAYVVALDPDTGAVRVGGAEDLLVERFTIRALKFWDRAAADDGGPLRVRIRYRQPAVPVDVEVNGDRAVLKVDRPIRAVAPGQLAVIYRGRQVVASGWIERKPNGSKESS
jgi:tRNA-specific 2-thiouridylase